MDGEGRAAGRSGRDEEVAERGEDCDEMLQPARRSEPLHCSLSPSQGHMRIFGPIIQALVRAMLDAGHDLPTGCGIGAELVGDHAPGAAALLMEKAAYGLWKIGIRTVPRKVARVLLPS